MDEQPTPAPPDAPDVAPDNPDDCDECGGDRFVLVAYYSHSASETPNEREERCSACCAEPLADDEDDDRSWYV